MKTVILLACVLLFGMTTVSAEQPDLLNVSTQTSHWMLEGGDQQEPLYDFPISRALGIEIQYTPTQPAERVHETRIFSFSIAAAR